jgi:predicted ArsR family transcriptional regulator
MLLKEAKLCWHWEAVRERSEALFASPHRLRVALLAAVADPQELFAAEIARAAEIRNMEATRELAHFEEAGLLVPASVEPALTARGRPARLLERRDEQAWEALQALGERFRRAPPSQRGGKP